MLIAMAGLPGTGKSTLSRRIASELNGVVLDKDVVRAALFPLEYIEYAPPQDDLVVSCMLQTAEYMFKKYPSIAVLIDGRPFSRRYQIEAVADFAAKLGEPFRLIECIASDEAVKHRLEMAAADGAHPAKNRSYEMYLATKARFQPIELPRLIVNTDNDLEQCVALCLQYIRDEHQS